MRFEIDGHFYRLRFLHQTEKEFFTPHGRQYGTIAFLEERNSVGIWVTANYGFSYLHEGDAFCKETGRRKSLTRLALAHFPDDKASRGVMWDAYWNRNVKPIQKEVA